MQIEEKVTGMYNQIPYPEYGNTALTDEYVKRKEFIDHVLGYNGTFDKVYKGKNVLEGGCGTGRESMYIASKEANLTAVDITEKSLNIAKEQSQKYNFKNKISFNKASVLDLPYKNCTFDIVLSSGVIHHTANPSGAFSELVRVLKNDGILIIYVYNNYAHFFSNIRRSIVNSIAGSDVHKRVKIAKKIFSRYTMKQTLATTYDEFGHPHKSEHSIREVLKWFENNNIEYTSVYPKLGFKGALATLHGWNNFKKGIVDYNFYKKHNNPTFSKIFSSELFQLIYGFRAYSGGYRFMGRKK